MSECKKHRPHWVIRLGDQEFLVPAGLVTSRRWPNGYKCGDCKKPIVVVLREDGIRRKGWEVAS